MYSTSIFKHLLYLGTVLNIKEFISLKVYAWNIFDPFPKFYSNFKEQKFASIKNFQGNVIISNANQQTLCIWVNGISDIQIHMLHKILLHGLALGEQFEGIGPWRKTWGYRLHQSEKWRELPNLKQLSCFLSKVSMNEWVFFIKELGSCMFK